MRCGVKSTNSARPYFSSRAGGKVKHHPTLHTLTTPPYTHPPQLTLPHPHHPTLHTPSPPHPTHTLTTPPYHTLTTPPYTHPHHPTLHTPSPPDCLTCSTCSLSRCRQVESYCIHRSLHPVHSCRSELDDSSRPDSVHLWGTTEE